MTLVLRALILVLRLESSLLSFTFYVLRLTSSFTAFVSSCNEGGLMFLNIEY